MTKEERKKETTSPDRDITPLLSLKLPQLRLVRFPVYEVVDVSVGVISHIYPLRSGAAMSAKEEVGAWLPTLATIFIGGALQFFVARVMSKTLAAPLGHCRFSLQSFEDIEAFEQTAMGPM